VLKNRESAFKQQQTSTPRANELGLNSRKTWRRQPKLLPDGGIQDQEQPCGADEEPEQEQEPEAEHEPQQHQESKGQMLPATETDGQINIYIAQPHCICSVTRL
jgi:hypothetical protein